MAESGNGQPGRTDKATRTDLQQILGDMDDETAVAILALDPNVSQIEEVGVWLSGDADVLGKEVRPFDTVVAQILDLVEIEEDETSAPKR
jgi:hypothetical protein